VNVAQGEAPLRMARHGNLSEGEILQEMQEQALHAAARQAASPLLGRSFVAPAPATPVPPTTSTKAQLAALLALDDANFVEQAFNATLHRPVDAEGLAYYTGQLATNARSKVEILGDLRYSPEGRKAKVRIPGLLSRYALIRSFRLPGIGRLIEVASGTILRARRSQADLLNGMAQLRSSTQGLQETIAHLDQRLARLQADAPSRPVDVSLQQVDARLQDVDARLQDIDARLATVAMDNWAEPLLALATQMDEQTQRARLLELQANDIVAVAAVLRGLRAEHGWPDEDAPGFAARLAALSRDVVRRATQAEETAQRNRAELLDQSRRLGLLLADVRRRLDAPFASDEAARLEAPDDHRLDPLYVAFEDRFRGSRPDIRERQRAHLPLLREVNAGGEGRPIVSGWSCCARSDCRPSVST
jgi:hypothetical protein